MFVRIIAIKAPRPTFGIMVEMMPAGLPNGLSIRLQSTRTELFGWTLGADVSVLFEVNSFTPSPIFGLLSKPAVKPSISKRRRKKKYRTPTLGR